MGCAQTQKADSEAGVVKGKSCDAQGHSLQRIVHSCTQAGKKKKNTQTSQTESTTNKLQQKVVNCVKVVCFELPFQGCHAAFVPSGKNIPACVSCSETSNYTAYYMAIERNTDKKNMI